MAAVAPAAADPSAGDGDGKGRRIGAAARTVFRLDDLAAWTRTPAIARRAPWQGVTGTAFRARCHAAVQQILGQAFKATTVCTYRSGIVAFLLFLALCGATAPPFPDIPSLPLADRDTLFCDFAALLSLRRRVVWRCVE